MSTDATRETSDSLRFDAAEPLAEAPSAPTCTNCGSEIAGNYHEANGQVVCGSCRAKLEEMLSSRAGGAGRFARALTFGVVGAAIGSGIYYAILALTGYEFGLVAIVVGWLTGRGVNMGAHGRGGWKYQALAIALTYIAIVSTYLPMAMREITDAPFLVLFIVVAIAPVAAGISNIIGMLIIGFALYQAWSMNRRLQITFTGPYEVRGLVADPSAGA